MKTSTTNFRQDSTSVAKEPLTNPRSHPVAHASPLSRRQAITGMAVGLGSLIVGSRVLAQTLTPPMVEPPAKPANRARTSLHQEVDCQTAPGIIYGALLDAKQFATFTGLPAEIDRKVGGYFSMFGGLIVGRNVELLPNERIVQAWRPTHWDPGVYSIVKFELKTIESTTKEPHTLVILDHTGFPEGDYDSLSSGWNLHYFDPLKKFLA